jgi:hypothetical protein
MFSFPLLWELSILLALISSTLIITSELLSSYYGKVDIRVNKKRLYHSAVVVTLLFSVTMAFRVITVLIH